MAALKHQADMGRNRYVHFESRLGRWDTLAWHTSGKTYKRAPCPCTKMESCYLNIHIGLSQNGGSCCRGKRALPVNILSGLEKEMLFRATISGLQKSGWPLDSTQKLVFPVLYVYDAF